MTGGLGFIGSNFIRSIISESNEYHILNLDAETYAANSMNLADIHGLNTYRYVRGDIRNGSAVERLLIDIDAIVHFAAETHVDRSITSPVQFIQTNIHGTFNLLEGARKTGVQRFVHISTDEVYGPAAPGESFDESRRLNPSSPYAGSKASAEMLVGSYHTTYGLDTIVLRCTNNFGPYQFPEKFIPKTIISALLGRKVSIYGTGRQVRDWTFVKDFCAATRVALERASSGSVYNVSAGNEMQNIEVATLVLQRLNKPTSLLDFVDDRPGHDARYSLDSRRLRRELSWRPSHSFSEALAETVDWYVKSEDWWRPLISSTVLSPKPWLFDGRTTDCVN